MPRIFALVSSKGLAELPVPKPRTSAGFAIGEVNAQDLDFDLDRKLDHSLQATLQFASPHR